MTRKRVFRRQRTLKRVIVVATAAVMVRTSAIYRVDRKSVRVAESCVVGANFFHLISVYIYVIMNH